jgi:hypothetical protein
MLYSIETACLHVKKNKCTSDAASTHMRAAYIYIYMMQVHIYMMQVHIYMMQVHIYI